MHIASLGIDLGKTTFHLVALGERKKILLRKKASRSQLLAYTANLPTSLIGLEACAGAHFVGTALREQGHEVRLIPAQFVKPYWKSNKNDFLDAEAIAEAVTKQNMRFAQRWSPPSLRPPSAMALPFVAGATSRPGWAWCPDSTPPGASRSCTASASAAMSICAAC
jgi:transposase